MVTFYDARSALLVVDVQNDFADLRGALAVPGGEEVAAVANREISRAGAGGAPVMYTQDWHPPRTPHFDTDGGPWPVHCVAGTWGAALVSDLMVAGPVVRKGTGGEDGYSGFSVGYPPSGRQHSTGLAELLRGGGVERVVIVGLATDHCVKETALDALRLGFTTLVHEEGVRAVDLRPGDGDAALRQLVDAGAEVI